MKDINFLFVLDDLFNSYSSFKYEFNLIELNHTNIIL